MRLIVGLGNPGQAYKYSRHNVGFLLIDKLTKIWGIKIKRDSTTNSYLGRGRIKDKEVILARPYCFMNLSGQSVNILLNEYRLNPQEEMLVVVDDLDLEWGNIRAQRNIDWIEAHCYIPDGKDVGQPVRLREWQKKKIRGIYSSPTRTVIISYGRKNAKTTFAAFL